MANFKRNLILRDYRYVANVIKGNESLVVLNFRFYFAKNTQIYHELHLKSLDFFEFLTQKFDQMKTKILIDMQIRNLFSSKRVKLLRLFVSFTTDDSIMRF